MTWTVVGSAVAEGNYDDPATYALPSGYAIGDLLLLFARCNAHDVVTGPSGWTLLDSETGVATTSKWVVYGRIATSTSETAPQIDWGGASTKTGITFALNDSNSVMSLGSIVGDPDYTYTASSGASIPFPACTVAEDNSIVFVFGSISKNNSDVAAGASALSGFTEAVEINCTGTYGSFSVLEYVIQTTKANISASSISITGGGAVWQSDGVIFYLKANAASGHPAGSRSRGIPGMNSIASRFGRGW